MICGVYILQQLYGAMINIGIYFMTYVLLNKNLFGAFSWAVTVSYTHLDVYKRQVIWRQEHGWR